MVILVIYVTLKHWRIVFKCCELPTVAATTKNIMVKYVWQAMFMFGFESFPHIFLSIEVLKW